MALSQLVSGDKEDSIAYNVLGFAGKDAAKDAAAEQERLNKLAVAENRRQFDLTKKDLDPFYQVGVSQIPALSEAATADGYGNALSQLMSGGLSQISNARNQEANDILSSMGIRRSGEGLGDIRPDEAMMIEQELNNRSASLAGRGQAAGTNITGFGTQSSNAIQQLLQNTGQAQAQGYIGQANALNQGLSNVNQIAAGVGGYYA